METRIYVIGFDKWKGDIENILSLDNEQFMSCAEEQGNVYSLDAFQNTYNHEDMNGYDSFMRIITVGDPIEEAKKVLHDAGYHTDNLWNIDDVKGKYSCRDDSQAHSILNGAFRNDATYDQIWMSIDAEAERNELPKYYPGLFSISGYYKDDKDNPFEGLLVYEYNSHPEDMDEDSIFFYGLSEHTIQEAIKEGGVDDILEFVITSYSKCYDD